MRAFELVVDGEAYVLGPMRRTRPGQRRALGGALVLDVFAPSETPTASAGPPKASEETGSALGASMH